MTAARIKARQGVSEHYEIIKSYPVMLYAQKFLEETDHNFSALNEAHEKTMSEMMTGRLLDALNGFTLPVSDTAISWSYAAIFSNMTGVVL